MELLHFVSPKKKAHNKFYTKIIYLFLFAEYAAEVSRYTGCSFYTLYIDIFFCSNVTLSL